MSKTNNIESFYEKELRRTIAQIRHEHTNYNRLASFYCLMPQKRHELNRIIGSLIQGQIDIPEFHSQVRKLERQVDLTISSNRRRFIKKYKQRIVSTKKYTPEQATKIAKSKLRFAIKFSEMQIAKQFRDMTDLFTDNSIFGHRPS